MLFCSNDLFSKEASVTLPASSRAAQKWFSVYLNLTTEHVLQQKFTSVCIWEIPSSCLSTPGTLRHAYQGLCAMSANGVRWVAQIPLARLSHLAPATSAHVKQFESQGTSAGPSPRAPDRRDNEDSVFLYLSALKVVLINSSAPKAGLKTKPKHTPPPKPHFSVKINVSRSFLFVFYSS